MHRIARSRRFSRPHLRSLFETVLLQNVDESDLNVDSEGHGQGFWVMIVIACLAAVAVAAPQYSYGAPRAASSEEVEFVPILKDDRVHEEDGTYNFDFEAANGISFSQAGSPDGDEDAVIKAGEYSYTAPDGSEIHVRFVADENGFQPQGAHLPVAPEFPHPIPQFVLDQIAKAAEEDAARARGDDSDEVSAPSGFYGRPN
ncbi:endocuticle structural glycoprotein ABD-4-like [Penaeus indicus]|uniref:endocuticle structural glycoprotein ABD-4-like n=1 Tax=Penaeus indicus TaxID=29960 RepID=UPI00300D2D8F